MALRTRDLWIVLRARDEASRALRNVSRNIKGLDDAGRAAADKHIRNGTALMTLGTGLLAFAGAGVTAMESLGRSARDYEKQAALALTQTDGVNTSLAEMKQLGRDIAREVPAALEQMQPALYDIFSTIDVNMKQARVLLKQFAKDSVAAGTDIATASKINLQMMNAFKVSVEDAADVSDFMFQLVRKGVGDYNAFAAALGKSIPSAKRAGQSYQQLGAMLSFMTRMGMNTAHAGTSAARALDALSHPTAVKRLEAMGIQMRNNNGEFRELDDILRDMQSKFQHLSKSELSEQLQGIFAASGGTIQARRFFNLLFDDFEEYEKHVVWMQNATGAAEEAYQTGAATSAAKAQALANALGDLRIEFGDMYNVVRDKVVVALQHLALWFLNLPEGIQKAVMYIAMIVTALAGLGGIIAVASGALLLIKGALAIFGVGLGVAAGAAAGFIAVIAAIAAIAYLVYKNWDKVKPVFMAVWDAIKQSINAAVPLVIWLKDKIVEVATDIWNTAKKYFMPIWEDISAGARAALPYITTAVKWLGDAFAKYLAPILLWVAKFVIGTLFDAIGGLAKGIIKVLAGALNFVIGVIKVIVGVVKVIVGLFKGIFTGDFSMLIDGFKMIGEGLVQVVKGIFQAILGAIQFIWNFGIVKVISVGWALIKGLFSAAGKFLINLIKSPFQWIYNFIKGIMQTIWFAIKGRWDIVVAVVKEAIKILRSQVSTGFNAVKSVITSALNIAKSVIRAAWRFIKSVFSGDISSVVKMVSGLKSKITSIFKSAGTWLKDSGKKIIQGLIDGVEGMIGKVKDAAGKAAKAIKDFFPFSPVKEGPLRAWNNGAPGRNLIDMGVINGILAMEKDLKRAMTRVTSGLTPGSSSDGFNFNIGGVPGDPTNHFPPVDPRDDGPGPHSGPPPVKIDIHTQEINPRKHAADLGYELQGRMG